MKYKIIIWLIGIVVLSSLVFATNLTESHNVTLGDIGRQGNKVGIIIIPNINLTLERFQISGLPSDPPNACYVNNITVGSVEIINQGIVNIGGNYYCYPNINLSVGDIFELLFDEGGSDYDYMKKNTGASYPYNMTRFEYKNGTEGGVVTTLKILGIVNVTTNDFKDAVPPVDDSAPVVTLLKPHDNDVNSSTTLNITYNVTDEGANLTNCDLWTNQTGDWILNTTSTDITNATENGFADVNFTDGIYIWNVECTDDNLNSTFATENYTLTIDTSGPIITEDTIRFNKTFAYDLFTGQINVSDPNLYSLYVLFDGDIWDNDTNNITNIANPLYVFNWSYNISSNSTDIHNITLKVCDGHTSKEIPIYDFGDGLFNNKLIYTTKSSEINIDVKDGSIFDSMTTKKELDRYTFEYVPNDKTKESYVFSVTSDNYIDIVTKSNSKWNTWLVTGDNWIDFYEEDRPQTIPTYRRISDNEVEVTITSNKDNIFSFSSVGDLNCEEKVYLWYKYNFTTKYAATILENTQDNMTINFTTNPSFIGDISADLYYDGVKNTLTKTTKTTGSIKEYSFSKNLYSANVTLNTNVSFYWNYSVIGNLTESNLTDTFTQTVNNIDFDSCSIYTTPVLNFTILNESNRGRLLSDVEYTLSLDYDGLLINTSNNLTSVNNFSICTSFDGGNYSADILVQYSATDYDTRDWIKRNYILDNDTDLIDLFLLTSTDSTAVDIHVKDENEEDISNVQIETEKYYISNNTYETVSIESTDSGGDAQFLLEVGSTYYRFNFYIDGTLRLQTDRFKITETALEYTISSANPDHPLVNWLRGQSVVGNLIYINTSNTFSFTYNDPNDYSSQVCLDITSSGKTYYSQCNTSSSSTMVYDVSEFNTTYTATASATVGGSKYTIDTLSINLRDFWRQFGVKESLMYSMIIFLIITLIGLKSPQIATGMGIVALIGLYALGMVPAGLTALFGICAVAVILIYIMRERSQ